MDLSADFTSVWSTPAPAQSSTSSSTKLTETEASNARQQAANSLSNGHINGDGTFEEEVDIGALIGDDAAWMIAADWQNEHEGPDKVIRISRLPAREREMAKSLDFHAIDIALMNESDSEHAQRDDTTGSTANNDTTTGDSVGPKATTGGATGATDIVGTDTIATGRMMELLLGTGVERSPPVRWRDSRASQLAAQIVANWRVSGIITQRIRAQNIAAEVFSWTDDELLARQEDDLPSGIPNSLASAIAMISSHH